MADKNDGKKYSQEELTKAIVDAELNFNSVIPRVEINIGVSQYHKCPEFVIRLTGGNLDRVHALARELSKTILNQLDNGDLV